MFYILNQAPDGRDKREAVFRGMYLTGDESLTSLDWIEKNVRSTGPLGALYPGKTHTAPMITVAPSSRLARFVMTFDGSESLRVYSNFG